jgi:hypothetical protein
LVLWEIINNKIPYHDINPGEVKAQVLNGMHPQPKETDGTPIEYQKIMEKGWDLSPTQRPTIEKLLFVLNELERKEKTWSKIPRIGDVDDNYNRFSNLADEVILQFILAFLF